MYEPSIIHTKSAGYMAVSLQSPPNYMCMLAAVCTNLHKCTQCD